MDKSGGLEQCRPAYPEVLGSLRFRHEAGNSILVFLHGQYELKFRVRFDLTVASTIVAAILFEHEVGREGRQSKELESWSRRLAAHSPMQLIQSPAIYNFIGILSLLT